MTLREQLLRDEGLRLMPYRDTLGVLTIGVGRNLDQVGISRQEALVLLDNDIGRAERGIALALPWVVGLSDARRAVLVNMAFNMGLGDRRRGLLSFRRALAAVEAGQWEAAATELLASTWATQVGARAQRLAEQLRTGEWR